MDEETGVKYTLALSLVRQRWKKKMFCAVFVNLAMPHSLGLKEKGHTLITGTDGHREHISFAETQAQRPDLLY